MPCCTESTDYREAQRGFTWDNVDEGRQGEEGERRR